MFSIRGENDLGDIAIGHGMLGYNSTVHHHLVLN